MRALAAIPFALVAALAAGPAPAQSVPDEPVSVSARSGPVTATLTAPSSQAKAGQAIDMSLRLEARDGATVAVPDLGRSLGPFDISGVSQEAADKAALRVVTLRFRAMTLDSGTVELPRIPVAATLPDGTPATFEVGPVGFTVQSSLAGPLDPTAIRDIKGPVEIDVGGPWWWIAAAAGAVALALAAAVTLRMARRPRAGRESPAHEWALERLDALAEDRMPERGEMHGYWIVLSDIVREYVERRFGIEAPDRTTEEFLGEARTHLALSEMHRSLLGQFLRMADMVKFAGASPSVGDCHGALDMARVFVRQTAPAAQAEGGSKEPAAPASARREHATPTGGAR